jgi:hypothetical protein
MRESLYYSEEEEIRQRSNIEQYLTDKTLQNLKLR